jgi:hypothetical protein
MTDDMQSTETGHEICRCLRSKEMFIHAEADTRLPSGSSGIFWCIHTYNCLGPDGRVAEPASCKPGRACYDAR